LYGEISHGVSEINIVFGVEGFTSRYKIQSYFPKFGREAPLGERVRAILNGIINPIDFSDLALLNPNPDAPTNPQLPDDPFIPPVFFDSEERAVRVTITEVNNVFTLSSTPGTAVDERYRGLDQNQYEKPPSEIFSSNPDFSDGAICIDGFLNIGDEAMYHTDEFELPGGNVVLRYFTQGRPFGNGTIVEVERLNASDSTKYDVTIVDPTASAQGIDRAIFSLEVLNGSVSVGDKTTLAAQGDAIIKPGNNDGTVFINGTTQAGAGVTAVEIIQVVSEGTNDALATCRELGIDSAGQYSIASGELFLNVVPIPFRQFAASGDRGFLSTSSMVPSGGFGKTGTVSFIEIVRPAMQRFGTL
jgi:hypothetical protein